jgi:hypothetical protein
MEVESEYQEFTCVTFEWTLRGLKALFDSTKGDTKSKVTRSPRFGDGRWQVSVGVFNSSKFFLQVVQVLFYANAGVQKEGNDGYVSLYLSCEVCSCSSASMRSRHPLTVWLSANSC